MSSRGKRSAPPSIAENDRFMPHVTLLVPAYNEEVTICESIRSLLRLRYPSFEIVICNDGSKDKTVEVLLRAFHFVRTEIEYDEQLATRADPRLLRSARRAAARGSSAWF